MKKDVFICHASEDKANIVYPIASAFTAANISYWLDEAEIAWGDSITQKVNDGLSRSNYVMVVLSQAFISKNWPQRELNSVLNTEASSGEVKVLPLICGDSMAILQKIPLISDKLYLTWNGDPSIIANALLTRLNRITSINANTAQPQQSQKYDIPIPNINKGFTDLDKRRFIKESLSTINSYFKEALQKLESSYQNIQTDFSDVTSQKFICTIYINGKQANQCKIWMGGLSQNSIAYSEGHIMTDSDNSYNEIISLEDDGQSMYLKFSMGAMYGHTADKRHTQLEAAESLWKRFTSSLR
jgi:hypothetical protein